MASEVLAFFVGLSEQIDDLVVFRGEGLIICGEMGLKPLQFFQLLCDDLGVGLELLVDVDVLLHLLFLFD